LGGHHFGNDSVRLYAVTQRALLVLAALGLFACTESPPPEPPPAVFSRIVSLAPNLTELVFAAGAGDTLVGVSAHSDYPAAALELPIIGDAFTVDQEQLALLQPDALLVWESGIPEHVVEDFRRVGYHVEIIRSRSLKDVALALRRIGELTGHQSEANAVADAFLADLNSLRERYSDAAAVSVFYQVYQRPLYTINGEHYVSELIEVCGGQNIFAELDSLAPAISVEAVIERNPEVMLASTDAGDNAFGEWQRWPNLIAVSAGNQYIMPADEIGRATPRLIGAGEAVCEALSTARSKRGAN
jgi:iron complex transport system substrate-binding protein